jgi:hypothetical protein
LRSDDPWEKCIWSKVECIPPTFMLMYSQSCSGPWQLAHSCVPHTYWVVFFLFWYIILYIHVLEFDVDISTIIITQVVLCQGINSVFVIVCATVSILILWLWFINSLLSADIKSRWLCVTLIFGWWPGWFCFDWYLNSWNSNAKLGWCWEMIQPNTTSSLPLVHFPSFMGVTDQILLIHL